MASVACEHNPEVVPSSPGSCPGSQKGRYAPLMPTLVRLEEARVHVRACVLGHVTLCNPMDCSLPGSSVHWVLQTRILALDCHALLQWIFPTQGLNPHLLHLLHCKRVLYY